MTMFTWCGNYVKNANDCELAGGRACVFHLIFTYLLAFEGKYI